MMFGVLIYSNNYTIQIRVQAASYISKMMVHWYTDSAYIFKNQAPWSPLKVIFVSIYMSNNFPTYPWNIPQTQNQQFVKEFLSFGGLGRPGVCSRGMLGFS